MELAFQTSKLRFLNCVLQEVQNQEETAETIVPDSFPDMDSIVDSYATAVIRGKDCRNGSVTISGGLKGGIIYQPEDGSWPRSLDFYIPFTTKLENPALTEQAQVVCSARVRSVDGRMVNSRKAMLRVNLGCQVTAYEQAEETLRTLQQQPDILQTRQNVYPLQLPLETSEKSFMISENLELSPGREPIAQIYKASCQPELTDRKLVANKAVFKGNLNCKILYLSSEQKLCLLQQQFPFSQYCELEEDYDDETVQVQTVITGYDLEPDPGDEPRRLLLTVHLLAQCTVCGHQNLEVTEDAYVTQGSLNPQWMTYQFESCLDRKQTLHTIRNHLEGPVEDVLDTDLYVDYPTVRQEGEEKKITAGTHMHVLGYDSDGRLCAVSGSTAAVQELSADRLVRCCANAEVSGSCYAATVSDGTEVRYDLAVETLCYGGQPIRSLAGGTMEDDAGSIVRPSVILRKTAANTSLWELAKECAAQEASIRAANHLEGDTLTEDRLLLIPIG